MTAPTAPTKVLFVSGSAASSTLRYRVRLPEEALRSRGVRTAAVHSSDRRTVGLAQRADVVVLYRAPASRDMFNLLQRLRERPVPPLITYDCDDLVFRTQHLAGMDFVAGLPPKQREMFVRDVGLRARLVPYADLLTGSTQQVLDELGQLSPAPTALLPNGVGRLGLELADKARLTERTHEGFRVGYFSGSATHDADWAAVENGVVEFLRGHPKAELWLVGKVTPTGALAPVSDQVRKVPSVDWHRLPALLRDVDVTLAPLDRNPFTEAKSAIKWLESALVETPTIATPTPPFEVAIEDGRTGLLAEKPQDWGSALERLAADPEERWALGRAAREAALEMYGPEASADRLLAVLTAGAPVRDVKGKAHNLPGGWRLNAIELEAYPFAADIAGMDYVPSRRYQVSAVVGDFTAASRKVGRRYYKGARRRIGRLVAPLRG